MHEWGVMVHQQRCLWRGLENRACALGPAVERRLQSMKLACSSASFGGRFMIDRSKLEGSAI